MSNWMYIISDIIYFVFDMFMNFYIYFVPLYIYSIYLSVWHIYTYIYTCGVFSFFYIAIVILLFYLKFKVSLVTAKDGVPSPGCSFPAVVCNKSFRQRMLKMLSRTIRSHLYVGYIASKGKCPVFSPFWWQYPGIIDTCDWRKRAIMAKVVTPIRRPTIWQHCRSRSNGQVKIKNLNIREMDYYNYFNYYCYNYDNHHNQYYSLSLLLIVFITLRMTKFQK